MYVRPAPRSATARLVVAILVVALGLGSMGTADAKKPSRTERTVQGSYGPDPAPVTGCNSALGTFACMVVETRPTERYFTAKVTDVHGQPVPGRLDLGDSVHPVAALSLAVAVAAMLGLLTYAVVVRPLHRAPPLAMVVSAVGVMIVLQALVSLRFGTDPITVAPLLPQLTVTLGETVLPADRLYLVALLGADALAAAALYRRIRLGLASRAATESRLAVELLGNSATRLSAINWVLGAVLAALFGIMLAPIAGLSPTGDSLLIVPALVAALAGRLSSTWTTVAAGLTLGTLQSQATRVHLP